MLWHCVCGSAYSVGAPHCPECGRDSDAVIEKDDDMARVTVSGGMTDILRPEFGPNNQRTEGSDDVSPGTSSSASPEKPETQPTQSERPARRPAGKTANPSKRR